MQTNAKAREAAHRVGVVRLVASQLSAATGAQNEHEGMLVDGIKLLMLLSPCEKEMDTDSAKAVLAAMLGGVCAVTDHSTCVSPMQPPCHRMHVSTSDRSLRH